MASECTVVIAPAELMGALTDRLRATAGELITCPDNDIARAIETVVERRPTRVALERLFAATSRGAALLTRLKADPGLVDVEIRIVSHDSDYSRVSLRRPIGGAPGSTTPAVPQPPPSLDKAGTRRVHRSFMADGVDVLVDGNQARLIDLSTLGAQVLSASVLRPNQRVRVSMVDERLTLRAQALIIWARFELPKGNPTPHYRAGLEFSGADADEVNEYLARHRRAVDKQTQG
jgi:hypothetical protein